MIEIPAHIQRLTAAAVNGEASSIGSLFEYYRPRLLAHALRICGNTPLAQDAVQDTFIAAFTHLDSLKNEGSFYPWLKKILVNNCYLLLRRERSVEFTDTHTNHFLLHRSIDDHFDSISNAQRVYEVLRFLSDELRACVILRYFSSIKSYDEISVILGIPAGTVKSRLSAAREKLAVLFRNKDDAGDKALKESQQWSSLYFHLWNNLHNDSKTRNDFFNHLHPALNVRFTSGKQGTGRDIVEKEINNDLIFGSRVCVNEVMSSGNITVVEADNINNPEHPDRCAPSMAIVFFRENDYVQTAHIFDSPRP